MKYNERIVLEAKEMEFNKVPPEELPPAKVKLKSQRILFLYDDCIVLSESAKYTGLNRHSNKRWYRWHTSRHIRFKVRELKNGRKYLFQYNGLTNREVPFLGWSDYTIFSEYVQPMCERLIGSSPENMRTEDKFFFYAKPLMVGHTPFETKIAQELRVSFRTNTFPEVAKKVFGKDRYRKDLVKAIAKCDTYEKLVDAKQLIAAHPNVPTDWLVEYLKADGFLGHHTNRNWAFIPFAHLRKFMVEPRRSLVQDVFRQLFGLNDAYREDVVWTGSVQAVHDRLVETRNHIYATRRASRDRIESKPFDYPEDLGKMVPALNEKGFYLPKDKSEMGNWSRMMNNCVSSYSYEVERDYTIILGYFEDETLVANIQVTRGALMQVLGKYNRDLEPSKFFQIADDLVEIGLIRPKTVGKALGAPKVSVEPIAVDTFV